MGERANDRMDISSFNFLGDLEPAVRDRIATRLEISIFDQLDSNCANCMREIDHERRLLRLSPFSCREMHQSFQLNVCNIAYRVQMCWLRDLMVKSESVLVA
jgi:hypothetical protein